MLDQSRRLLPLAVALLAAVVAVPAAAQPAAPAAKHGPTQAEPAPPAASTAPAPAQPDDDAKARALELYEQGSQAFALRRYGDAITLFLQADALANNASFAYNIAVAYGELGESSNALKWWREYRRRSPNASDRAEVDRKVAWYEQKLRVKGVQQVTVLSSPAGAAVRVDGQPQGETPWTGDLAPGSHLLSLQLDGYEGVQQTFELDPAHAMDLEVALTRKAPPATAPPPPPPAPTPVEPPDAEENDALPVGPWTWASLGVGVASGVVAVVLEIVRAGAEEDARNEPIQVEAEKHAQAMEDYEVAAQVMLGVGIGAVVLGGVLLIVDLTTSSDDSADDSAVASSPVDVTCDHAGCSLAVRGMF